MAINRFNSQTKFSSRAQVVSHGITCVFISHQQQDKQQAAQIADTLLAAGIDVYFDAYDLDLKFHHQSKNAKGVTDAIKKGINNSSHMLVIASPNTVFSTWVPFEVGYGHDKTDLSILCLKGIAKGSLPEYCHTARIIRDIYDLNDFIIAKSNKSAMIMKYERSIYDYSDNSNPLNKVMDSIINERS